KMGISTVQSYCGAQIFEAIGLNLELVDGYFTGTASRIEGIGIREIGEETLRRHKVAYEPAPIRQLDFGGEVHYRVQGEHHNWNPETISKLQHAAQANDPKTYKEFAALVNDESKRRSNIRGLLEIKTLPQPIPLEEVEPAKELVKRFTTGAMSFGAIGKEVDETIAKLRYATPGVQLISPPPHHDIYSIEDLAQLIYDLKNSNPAADISVKLVAEIGVGTVAAGVSKAKADKVLISGDSGGTGASPLSSIKYGGIPWELGLAETQQTLVLNNLRGRIRVETDGQLKTGRDVVIAALLGAEEFGFSTAPLIVEGCIMMRKCHLNTCPVGIATHDPVLRAKFTGQPEHVVNYFFFVAEEVREWMAKMGFRKFAEMIGRTDKLRAQKAIDHWKAKGLDLAAILKRPEVGPEVPRYCVEKQDHGLDRAIDWKLIELCKLAIERKEPVRLDLPIRNVNRTVGTILSSEIAKRYRLEGL